MERIKKGDDVICIDVEGLEQWRNYVTGEPIMKGNSYRVTMSYNDQMVMLNEFNGACAAERFKTQKELRREKLETIKSKLK